MKRKTLPRYALHLQTGNLYTVIGEAIDCTNGRGDQIMKVYEKDGKLFVREATEFDEKFTELT